MAPRVVLVGPPGSGKSTVGQALAAVLDLPFADTDSDIEAEVGIPISDLFIEHGEAHFRKLERSAIQRALAAQRGVLALGGGAVQDPESRADLLAHNVVFLDVPLADAAHRVGFDTSRPLLLGNVRGQLKALMDSRRPLYQEVATVTVNTGNRTPDVVTAEIVRVLEQA